MLNQGRYIAPYIVYLKDKVHNGICLHITYSVTFYIKRETIGINRIMKYLQKIINEIINKKKISTGVAFGFCGTAIIVKQLIYTDVLSIS